MKYRSPTRIRQKWEACKADPSCKKKALTAAKRFAKFERSNAPQN